MVKKRKEKNIKFYFAIGLFVVSLLVILFSLSLNKSIILDKGEFKASLTISEKTGFDLNTTAMTFGNILPGSSSSRSFLIENTHDFPIIVWIGAEGDIERFLSFEQKILIGEGESKKIGVSAIIPSNESYGDYSGKIVYIIKRDI